MPGVRLPVRPGVAVFTIAAVLAALALVFDLGSWDVENDEALEREIAAASGEDTPPPPAKPALPARFTRKPTGWK